MTMREVVSKLQSQGHSVDFYVRKDGGILIRSLDGVRYTGAKGNIMARQLAGTSISEARSAQLKYATRAQKVKKPTLDDELRKEYERVKRKWNKAFKSKGGKPHPAGYFGWSRIKYALENYGRNEALRRIREAERYASGIAYSKNVEILSSYITSVGNSLGSKELLKLADGLLENAYKVRDEWIDPAYDELYKLNQGKSPEEVARRTRAILRL